MFETALPVLALWAVIGYLLGSVPFGIVITRALGLGDLRQIGSGNIGATNVLRTGNKPAAAATLFLDSFKGGIAVLLALWLASPGAAQMAGLAAFVGHCFPVWLRFQGGKGVATFLGTVLALAWPVGIACCLSWLATAAITRISSASALVAAVLSPIWALVLGRGELWLVCALMALLILWRHSANIQRILKGEEPKIGKKG
ncbi:MAG: glycerol-3-phosphate 1-O-acyltransferase PlsY [Pelagimonas sp.]|jgi:glycerol-3-phosphate acyltransferase PlsY|nr:glycerol-3-phosphate 1-O-acyltransferase PlsY [Pelagimonas sp.]